MKAYLNVRFFYSASILLLLLIISGCSATRFLSKDQALVRKVSLEGIDKQLTEQAYIYVQQEIRPNSRINLALYNLFNTKNGKYRTDKIKNIGEAPHLLDTPIVEISRNEIEKFLKTKGYFNAEVKSEIDVKNKKAYITFVAKPGPAFKLRNYTYSVADSNVKELYEQNRQNFTHLSEGMRYDLDSLNYEREQVVNLLKRNGYYEFEQQYMRGTADTNLNSSQVDVRMFIDNPPGEDSHQVFTLNNTYISISNSSGRTRGIIPDSAVLDSQYYFKDYSHRFRFKTISRYIFFDKGDRFNIEKRDLTYNRLYDLNIFKTVKIDFVKADDSTSLNVNIDAVPQKKMSDRVEAEYTFNSGRNGFNLGNTYTNRNLFGGAEQLDIKLRYGVLFDSRVEGSLLNRIFNRDFQIGVNVTVPKLILPFKVPSLGKFGVPRTTFSSSLQLFDQLNTFSNRLFINSVTYNWAETKLKQHSLTPAIFEYRDGRLAEAFKQSLIQQNNLFYVLTNDRRYFNLGSQYNYTVNALKLNLYENFKYLRASVDLGGNTIGLFANILKLHRDSTGARTFLGLPYLQYAKTEIDFRLYKSFGGERQFVARFNPAIIYAYGNTDPDGLPFEKNFYAGGSTGIRAWQARTLGPGNYNRKYLESDEQRENLTYLDQVGDIKFEGNFEYRFKIADNLFSTKVKGAFFTDYGNIWNLNPRESVPNGEIQLNKLFKQIAIGAGAGLRLDWEYFIFRFDVGVKVKDPQFIDSDQWVIKRLFRNNKQFKEEYHISNFPDRYRFVQYNFGIGMPF